LQIGHDGYFTPSTASSFAHGSGTLNMVLGLAVAEIKAHNIHPGNNHGF
jgi:hypothetical protein